MSDFHPLKSCGSRCNDTTSSERKFKLFNLAVRGLGAKYDFSRFNLFISRLNHYYWERRVCSDIKIWKCLVSK